MTDRLTFRWSDQGGTDDRLRCTGDHKVVMNERAAKAAGKDYRMDAYECCSGFWHIGHRRERDRRGPSS